MNINQTNFYSITSSNTIANTTTTKILLTCDAYVNKCRLLYLTSIIYYYYQCCTQSNQLLRSILHPLPDFPRSPLNAITAHTVIKKAQFLHSPSNPNFGEKVDSKDSRIVTLTKSKKQLQIFMLLLFVDVKVIQVKTLTRSASKWREIRSPLHTTNNSTQLIPKSKNNSSGIGYPESCQRSPDFGKNFQCWIRQ